VERTQLGLERALDFVETAAVKPGHELPAKGPGLLELISGEMRKAIGAAGQHPRRHPRR
jgi:hypothetical protein